MQVDKSCVKSIRAQERFGNESLTLLDFFLICWVDVLISWSVFRLSNMILFV